MRYRCSALAPNVRRFEGGLPRNGVRRQLVVPLPFPVVNHEFASIDAKEV
jgi:hypothetical protein